MKFLEKIRELPLEKRKIILYSIVSVVGLFLLFFWIRGLITGFDSFREQREGGELIFPYEEMPPGIGMGEELNRLFQDFQEMSEGYQEIGEMTEEEFEELKEILDELQKMDEEELEMLEKLIDESQENNEEDLTDIKKLLKNLQKIKEIKETEN